MDKNKIIGCMCCKELKLCIYSYITVRIWGNFYIPGTFIKRHWEGYLCKKCRKKSARDVFLIVSNEGWCPEN